RPFHVQVNGHTVAGEAWGAGPVVCLVHGWGAWGGQVGVLGGPLAERGHRVVTFDAPSHGASDPGLAGPGRRTILEFADALTAGVAANGPAHAPVLPPPLRWPPRLRRAGPAPPGGPDRAPRRHAPVGLRRPGHGRRGPHPAPAAGPRPPGRRDGLVRQRRHRPLLAARPAGHHERPRPPPHPPRPGGGDRGGGVRGRAGGRAPGPLLTLRTVRPGPSPGRV